jgi:hypothetical protein
MYGSNWGLLYKKWNHALSLWPPVREEKLTPEEKLEIDEVRGHGLWPSNCQTMKKLHIVTPEIEVGAGVARLCCPSATMALPFESGLDPFTV